MLNNTYYLGLTLFWRTEERQLEACHCFFVINTHFIEEVALHPTKLLVQYADTSYYYIIRKTKIVSVEVLEFATPYCTRSFHWQMLKRFL
jgi:hypothetical protein